MKNKNFIRTKKGPLFYRFKADVKKVIKKNYYSKLQQDPENAQLILSTAQLEFAEGEFQKALSQFTILSESNCDSIVWEKIAQCERNLWKKDSDAGRLERAGQAYKNALKLVERSPFLIHKLPSLLFQLASTYEDFGAFDGAFKLYGQVMNLFPQTNLMDLILFRLTIVLKHLSTLSELSHQKKDLLENGLAYLKPLLVEKPATGLLASHTPLHLRPNRRILKILYIRICEEQRNPVSKMLAAAAWEDLFKERLKNHEDLSECSDWQDWLTAPITWVTLATECFEAGERTLVVDLLKRGRYAKGDNLGYDALMKAAKAYASFQQIEEAIRYAEMALEAKPLDSAAMALLSSLSPYYKWYFETLLKMTLHIQRNWRTRPWKEEFRKRVKLAYISTMEERLKKNEFDAFARKELVYYSKSNWRPLILLEQAAARRIQRAYKNHSTWERWIKSKRENHLRKLVSLYRKWRKYPFDMELRKTILELIPHKDTPLNHKIRELPAIFEREERCAEKLQRQFYVWKSRQFLRDIRNLRALLLYEKQQLSATKIKYAWYRKKARDELKRHRQAYRERVQSAIQLQRIWRGKRQKWNFVCRIIAIRKEQKRLELMKQLALLLQCLWRRFVCMSKYIQCRCAIIMIQKVFRGSQGRKVARERRYMFVCRIQKAWWSFVEWEKIKLLSKRMKLKHSHPELNMGGNAVDFFISEYMQYSSTMRYTSPGINPLSNSFQRMLRAEAVVVNSSIEQTRTPETPQSPQMSFDAQDAILLSAVLSHRECNIKTLLLKNANLSNDKGAQALANALSCCRSLTFLGISGCALSFHGTSYILEAVRTQNFKLSRIIMESNGYGFANSGADCAGKFIRDYFQHKFGHCSHLAFTQNEISDIGVSAISEALAQNSKLLSLDLRGNFIGDEGATALGNALKVNSSLVELDLCDNCITSKGAKNLFKALKDNSTLIKLGISNNLIKIDGIDALKETLAFNITLQDIDLFGNMLTSDEEDQFQNWLRSRNQLLSNQILSNTIQGTGLTRTNTPLRNLEFQHKQKMLLPKALTFIQTKSLGNQKLRKVKPSKIFVSSDLCDRPIVNSTC